MRIHCQMLSESQMSEGQEESPDHQRDQTSPKNPKPLSAEDAADQADQGQGSSSDKELHDSGEEEEDEESDEDGSEAGDEDGGGIAEDASATGRRKLIAQRVSPNQTERTKSPSKNASGLLNKDRLKTPPTTPQHSHPTVPTPPSTQVM